MQIKRAIEGNHQNNFSWKSREINSVHLSHFLQLDIQYKDEMMGVWPHSIHLFEVKIYAHMRSHQLPVPQLIYHVYDWNKSNMLDSTHKSLSDEIGISYSFGCFSPHLVFRSLNNTIWCCVLISVILDCRFLLLLQPTVISHFYKRKVLGDSFNRHTKHFIAISNSKYSEWK